MKIQLLDKYCPSQKKPCKTYFLRLPVSAGFLKERETKSAKRFWLVYHILIKTESWSRTRDP
jgi:hypothetical protein